MGPTNAMRCRGLLKYMGSTLYFHKVHGEVSHQVSAYVPCSPFKGSINVCVSLKKNSSDHALQI